MVLYVTESEMIQRFKDGLQKASSRADDFLKVDVIEKPTIFSEFLDGIKVAAGSAHQLAHIRESPKWLRVRDILELCIVIGQSLPVHKQDDGAAWKNIKTQLDGMCQFGLNLYNSSPEKRSDVLVALAIREQDERSKNDVVPVNG